MLFHFLIGWDICARVCVHVVVVLFLGTEANKQRARRGELGPVSFYFFCFFPPRVAVSCIISFYGHIFFDGVVVACRDQPAGSWLGWGNVWPGSSTSWCGRKKIVLRPATLFFFLLLIRFGPGFSFLDGLALSLILTVLTEKRKYFEKYLAFSQATWAVLCKRNEK